MCFIGKKEKGISFAAGSFREFFIIERKMSEELAVCSLRWDLVSGSFCARVGLAFSND